MTETQNLVLNPSNLLGFFVDKSGFCEVIVDNRFLNILATVEF